jgi:NAD(P)H-flavin reductase
MLEAVRAMCERAGVPAQLALEAGMACGFGACYGCAVPRRGGGYLRVCVDGPVVDAALLDEVLEPGSYGDRAGATGRAVAGAAR